MQLRRVQSLRACRGGRERFQPDNRSLRARYPHTHTKHKHAHIHHNNSASDEREHEGGPITFIPLLQYSRKLHTHTIYAHAHTYMHSASTRAAAGLRCAHGSRGARTTHSFVINHLPGCHTLCRGVHESYSSYNGWDLLKNVKPRTKCLM